MLYIVPTFTMHIANTFTLYIVTTVRQVGLRTCEEEEEEDMLLDWRILVQQCFEFGAVNCQKERTIFIRISIIIT